MTTIAPGTKAAFAAEHDAPIPYMQRTRDYYQVLGFSPYRWAHFVEVPFTPLRVPLDRARVALITTAAPYQANVGDQGPGAAYNAAAKFYQVYSIPTETEPDLRFSPDGAGPPGPASTAPPRTGATGPRWRPTFPSSCVAAARTESMPPSSSPAD